MRLFPSSHLLWRGHWHVVLRLSVDRAWYLRITFVVKRLVFQARCSWLLKNLTSPNVLIRITLNDSSGCPLIGISRITVDIIFVSAETPRALTTVKVDFIFGYSDVLSGGSVRGGNYSTHTTHTWNCCLPNRYHIGSWHYNIIYDPILRNVRYFPLKSRFKIH